MSLFSISYDAFNSSNQGLRDVDGPWTADPDSLLCTSDDVDGCTHYCLQCTTISISDHKASYHPTFNANISVNLANYGDATSLDFTWAYWPLYCASNTTPGSSFPIHSQVGDAGFDDTFAAVNWTTFFRDGHLWDPASKLSHSGSTSVVLGSDPTTGYIPLSIGFTMTPHNSSEVLNYFVQGMMFRITTPLQQSPSSPGSSPSPSFTTTTATSISTSPSNSSDFPTLPPLTINAFPSSSSTFVQPMGPSPSSSTSTIPVSVVTGASIGGVAFVALLFFALFLFRKRREEKR